MVNEMLVIAVCSLVIKSSSYEGSQNRSNKLRIRARNALEHIVYFDTESTVWNRRNYEEIEKSVCFGLQKVAYVVHVVLIVLYSSL